MTAEMRKQSKLFTIHRHKMLIIDFVTVISFEGFHSI